MFIEGIHHARPARRVRAARGGGVRVRVPGVAARRAGQRRRPRRNRQDAQRERRGPRKRGRRRRRAERQQAGGPLGSSAPDGARRVSRPGVRTLVRRRLLDDEGQRDGWRPVERCAAVQRLAELRSGPGRRGALDRLRGHRTHSALGELVRENERRRLRAEQRLRKPLRQHRRRQPGQVDLRWPEPRHRRRLGAGPVTEHRHQSIRRKPVDRRRLGRRPDEARSVGDVAGVLRPRRR